MADHRIPLAFHDFRSPKERVSGLVAAERHMHCSPPEELVMPQKFPRAPLPAFSALFAPLAWQFGRPDLFDAYSAGVVFMQLAGVPPGVLLDRQAACAGSWLCACGGWQGSSALCSLLLHAFMRGCLDGEARLNAQHCPYWRLADCLYSCSARAKAKECDAQLQQ